MPRHALFLACIPLFLACAEVTPIDSAAFLRQQSRARLGTEAANRLAVPFELAPEVLAEVDRLLSPRGDDRYRAQQVVNLIFGQIGFEYALHPTLNADEAFRTRRGNCLSFVNLFIGIARHIGLNPTYVEVVDHHGWSYQQGTVVSRGHIVAGLLIDGKLETFDFLPYRPKSYRHFQTLDDRLAVAHFYNNLGAEALIAGDVEKAEQHLSLVTQLAPELVSGLNNLGICEARLGRPDAALATYNRGLEHDPTHVAVLTNLARLHQQQGRLQEAEALLVRADATRQASPFFHVSRAERALSQGEHAEAQDHLREALRRDSEVPEVHLGLVKLYLALGDLERAKHHLGRASKLDPSHPKTAGYRGLLADGRP